MKNRLRLKGKLSRYVQWPLFLGVLMAVMNIGMLAYDVKSGMVMGIFTLFYLLVASYLYFTNKSAIFNGLVNFATDYGQVQRMLLKEFTLPYAILDEDCRFVWQNRAFSEFIGKDSLFGKSATSYISDINREILPDKGQSSEFDYIFSQKFYHIVIRSIELQDFAHGQSFLSLAKTDTMMLYSVMIFDETELSELKQKNRDEQLVTGLIYVDNFDEVMESVEEVRSSLLSALVDRKINKYFAEFDAIVKKTEVDKFFVVMRHAAFEQLEKRRFDILEEIKTVNIGNEMHVTLSIGFGLADGRVLEDASYAKSAIDLALGRGGDQAVVKTRDKVTYYGGKSQQVDKNTRVKARVKAHALRGIIESKENVIVMGHAMSDVDAFGAAVGIYRAARQLGKPCNIVINEVTSSIRTMLDDFMNSSNYETGTIVDSQEAINITHPLNTAVVVVDTNRPRMTECPELLKSCKTIVVLDHHRQAEDRIDNAILSYIEPYASSACEMVAEILQYIDEHIKVKGLEADCLYAGIMIDTNNFMSKTGVRTFEAAAFLRRCGADMVRVRKIFRNDFVDYKARAEAVRNASLYRDNYAIAVCPSEGLDSPTIVGAQAANELLNINLVKASFVLTAYAGKIYISARSIDEVNVQLIMEKLGGGGHLNMAGAQIADKSIDEAIELLEHTIDSMISEGEI